MDGGCEHLVQYRVHSGQAENAVRCTSFLSHYSVGKVGHLNMKLQMKTAGAQMGTQPAEWPLLTCEILQCHGSHQTINSTDSGNRA